MSGEHDYISLSGIYNRQGGCTDQIFTIRGNRENPHKFQQTTIIAQNIAPELNWHEAEFRSYRSKTDEVNRSSHLGGYTP